MPFVIIVLGKISVRNLSKIYQKYFYVCKIVRLIGGKTNSNELNYDKSLEFIDLLISCLK
jgi:hypothetical protein